MADANDWADGKAARPEVDGRSARPLTGRRKPWERTRWSGHLPGRPFRKRTLDCARQLDGHTDGTQGQLAPGAADAAILPGGLGVQFQIIGGPGSAPSLTTYGNNALEGGSIAVGTPTMGSATGADAPATLDNSDALDIEPGALVTAGSVAVYRGGGLPRTGRKLDPSTAPAEWPTAPSAHPACEETSTTRSPSGARSRCPPPHAPPRPASHRPC